jgi:hypothetical protein
MCAGAVDDPIEERADTACPVCRGMPCVVPAVCERVASGVRAKYTAAGRMARFRCMVARGITSRSSTATIGACCANGGCQ